MEFNNTLSGTAPVLKKYPIGATTIANIPLLIPAAGGGGLAQPTATSAANMVGMCLDAGTLQTAQNADGSDPEALVQVIINPDAVYRAKLSGGTANNTALAAQVITTGSTTGLVVTTAAEWSSPTFDEGIVWGFSGANAIINRQVVSVSSTAGTVKVAFPNDIAIGDVFLRAPFYLFTAGITLTATFDQVNCAVAVAASAAALIPMSIQGLLRDEAGDGKTDSFVDVISGDHALSGRPT